ncbi:MAG: hypothetical protein LLG04_00105 [Parachlamydia sp.]|nr:hypothetical protein [Parachlamydia sp.]
MIPAEFRAHWPKQWEAVGEAETLGSKQKEPSENLQAVSAKIDDIALNTPQAVARHVLPALDFSQSDKDFAEQNRRNYLARHPNNAERLIVRTSDGIPLEGMLLWNHPSDFEQKHFDRRHWILYLVGNGECYEDNLEFLEQYGRETGCNVAVFNYRGVLASQGFPTRASDLVLDGDAFFQYLQSKHVKSRHILIHGHSLGGAVGTCVRSLHPKGPLCNERSFADWKSVELAIFGPDKSQQMGAAVDRYQWDFPVVESWNKVKGYKWIVVSPTDEVVDYRVASLYKRLKAGHARTACFGSSAIHVVKLPKLYSGSREKRPIGHNVPLTCNDFKEAWRQHKAEIAKAW